MKVHCRIQKVQSAPGLLATNVVILHRWKVETKIKVFQLGNSIIIVSLQLNSPMISFESSLAKLLNSISPNNPNIFLKLVQRYRH